MHFDRRGFVAGAVGLVGLAAMGRAGLGQSLTVRVQFEAGGRVSVASPAGDSKAMIAQIVARALNLRSELIDVSLVATEGSSCSTEGVRRAALRARATLLAAAAGDPGSPLYRGQRLDFVNGRIIHQEQPQSGESFNAFLARNRNLPVGTSTSIA
jgi:CO/xanthine dehydrogenase Mo-binding subunit